MIFSGILNEMRQRLSFLGALFIHGIALVAFLPQAQWVVPLNQLKEKTIEIISPDDLKDSEKPVVKSSQIEEEKSASNKTARFSGEFQQRTEQETQSPVKGLFEESKRLKMKESPEVGGESIKDFLAFGKSPNALPKDIPYGNETVLNTDKVRYASFINRIADEIYEPWVDAAERALREFAIGRRKMEPNIYITRLRVTLDPSGSITGIQIVDSCGISELDEAPKKAFWESEPFPNPPSQLMETDGYVRLTYEFQFEWKNSGFNIVPWKI